jgi:hypothetical protein
MDLARTLDELRSFLEGQGFPYAVIGGVALVAYGLPRTTLDLDLAVEFRSQEAVIGFLEARGYRTLHRSRGYSNHLRTAGGDSRVDLVYVDGETSVRLFSECRRLPGPRGDTIPVARPEHLVAMKVLAMKNDPERAFRELEDLRFLLRLPGMDREEARGYFERHGLAHHFRELIDGPSPGPPGA